MKLWTAMFFIMIAIIVVGFSLESSILKATDSLSRSLDLVKESVRSARWQEALELWEQIDKTWRVHQEHWNIFIHNDDLDDVTIHLARLKSYLENEEQASSLAEIVEVEIQLVQLHKQEVLTLKNIF